MKFANVTYGTHGDTKEYTYLVNDNVKAGEVLQPSVIHYKSGKVFATTGIAQRFPDSVPDGIAQKVVAVRTGADMGISSRIGGEKGRFAGSYSKTGRVGGRMSDAGGKYHIVGGKEYEDNKYIDAVRGANIADRLTSGQGEPNSGIADSADAKAQKNYESYDQYVGRFMKNE